MACSSLTASKQPNRAWRAAERTHRDWQRNVSRLRHKLIYRGFKSKEIVALHYTATIAAPSCAALLTCTFQAWPRFQHLCASIASRMVQA